MNVWLTEMCVCPTQEFSVAFGNYPNMQLSLPGGTLHWHTWWLVYLGEHYTGICDKQNLKMQEKYSEITFPLPDIFSQFY